MNRMKIANGLFALSAVLFALAFSYRMTNETAAASVLYFLTQSAFIGCAADWFAVSALFRKPLGFPFHTALIPRHRGRIIAGIRRMTEEKLLRPALWDSLFETFSASRWLSGYSETKTGREAAARIAEDVKNAAEEYAKYHADEWAEAAARGVSYQAETMARRLPALLTEEGRIEKRLAELLAAAAKFSETEDAHRRASHALRDFTETQKGNPLVAMAISMGEAMGLIDYDNMARALCAAAREKIEAWQKTDSAEFKTISAHFGDALAACLASQAGEEAIRKISVSFIENLNIREKAARAAEEILADEKTGNALREATLQTISEFLGNEETARALDAAVRDLLTASARREHRLLGETVETVLTGYDERRLNNFIYTRTADELGWIRINGAIVATIAGALVYALLFLAR